MLDVFLRDKLRNQAFDLRSDDKYAFTSGSSPNIERFSIVFRNKGITSIHKPDAIHEPANRLTAYSDKLGHIIVTLHTQNSQEGKENVSVFNITGHKLLEQTIVAGERTPLVGTFARGVYLLRAGRWSAKVMVY
jgi:hypothetical protein